MSKFLLITIISLLSLNNKKDTRKPIAKQPIIEQTTSKNKNIEIVFCLDATGSMEGLIETAKEKIWEIVSQLAQSNDVESLKLGMVFYRDKGDSFITKKIQLTTDLDEVYDKLLNMKANGGGDTPESVNQALNEAITEIEWSDSNAYKTIFVVGDCPPHMDYQDDVKYTSSCKIASKKGITINTIKLGQSCTNAIAHFKAMANCCNGDYLQLDQNASDVVIKTPYDDAIYEISKSIDESRVYYGTKEEQMVNYQKKEKSLEVYERSSKTSNTARASYKMSKAGKKSLGTQELIHDYTNHKINIDDLSEDELPKYLIGKNKQEIKDTLEKLKDQRIQNELKISELLKKKKEYIKNKKSTLSESEKTSFSQKVVEILKKQSL